MVSPQTSFWLALAQKGKDKMNSLPLEKKLAVISALVEGNSIRSISRMTNVDRNTISSLLLRTGERCLLPLSKHLQIDTYYEHLNNTGVHPNHQVNAAGLMINLYFPPYKG